MTTGRISETKDGTRSTTSGIKPASVISGRISETKDGTTSGSNADPVIAGRIPGTKDETTSGIKPAPLLDGRIAGTKDATGVKIAEAIGMFDKTGTRPPPKGPRTGRALVLATVAGT